MFKRISWDSGVDDVLKLFLHFLFSQGTKVGKMLTLAPESYIAGFCMVAKVILWCI